MSQFDQMLDTWATVHRWIGKYQPYAARVGKTTVGIEDMDMSLMLLEIMLDEYVKTLPREEPS